MQNEETDTHIPTLPRPKHRKLSIVALGHHKFPLRGQEVVVKVDDVILDQVMAVTWSVEGGSGLVEATIKVRGVPLELEGRVLTTIEKEEGDE